MDNLFDDYTPVWFNIYNREGRCRKIKKTFILTLFLVVVLLVLTSNKSFAYSLAGDSLTPSLINPLDYLNKQISTTSPALPNLSGGLFKGFISGPASEQFKLLNTQNLSFNDLTGSLKSVAILAINLFLVVIQVVAGILKALLPFLK